MKIAIEAGVWEQTWHASNMDEVCEIIMTRYRWQREQLAELTAEVARLKAEADQTAASYTTIHVPTWHVMQAMIDNREVEPGTVMRETDGQCRDYLLGEDHTWRERT